MVGAEWGRSRRISNPLDYKYLSNVTNQTPLLGGSKCHLNLESCQRSWVWKPCFWPEWFTNSESQAPEGFGFVLCLDSYYQLWFHLLFIFCFHSIKLSWLLLITPSPSSRAYQSRTSSASGSFFSAMALGSLWSPPAPQLGPRWQSHAEYCSAFSCNSRLGFGTRREFFLGQLTVYQPWLVRSMRREGPGS